MLINAYDGVDKFQKKLEIRVADDGRTIVSMGFPIEYNLETLLEFPPSDGKICIDAMGRNHKGRATYINYTELMIKVERLLNA